MSYPFISEYRAQCVNVVDGDTVDLILDRGFFEYIRARFRLARIDTCELNSKDEKQRGMAREATELMVEWLKPRMIKGMVRLDDWPLRIVTKKDPDNFGRWLTEIYFQLNGKEVNTADELLRRNLACLYKRGA